MGIQTPEQERDYLTGTPPDILNEQEVEAQDETPPAPEGLVNPD